LYETSGQSFPPDQSDRPSDSACLALSAKCQNPKFKCQIKSQAPISNVLDFELWHSFEIWILNFVIALPFITSEAEVSCSIKLLTPAISG